MLNPPLSLLSDELLDSIVERLAKLPFSDENFENSSLADQPFTQNPPLSLSSEELLASFLEQLVKLPFFFQKENLKNLSLADRAFTQSCQKYIFRELILGRNRNLGISKQLTNVKEFLDDKPSFANQVRAVHLHISLNESAPLFRNPDFTSILQLFAKSPMPPHELHFDGYMEDPVFVMRRLSESFFSQTLTILHLREITNVPLPLFLICPRLRELLLDQCGATDKSYDKYPDNQCSGQEVPLLEVLNYRNSQNLVEQMIAPPPRFSTPVVLWSNLRVFTLAPHDKEGMAYLQPILDTACNTLEELYLTNLDMGDCRQLPLAGLVNLSNLSNLQVFALDAFVNCKSSWKREASRKAPAILLDINTVLGTIPKSNRLTNFWFNFSIVGRHPFHGCLDEDWVGMFNEVIRIGGGKPLELELSMVTTTGDADLEREHPGDDELYMRIIEKAASLSDYPNICTHWWNPSYWSRDIGPFPRGQVRRRCTR